MENKFRSFEHSNPEFGTKNLSFITVKSSNLRGRGDICIYIPENCPDNVSVTILLHGVYGSAWSWALSSGVHEQVDIAIAAGEIQPMILLMPSDGMWGDGSGYLNQGEIDFEKWIIEDVIQAARQFCPEFISDNSQFFIAGLSMGGYGAIRLGSRHPKIFSAFSGLSSITSIPEFSFFVEEDLKLYEIDTELALIDSVVANNVTLVPFRFDCGKEDLLIDYNRKLHTQLQEAGIDHIYEEFEGGHSWDYWKNNIMKTILFFNLHTNTNL
jgi:enterochelin esterase-like enzyme